MAKSKKKAEKRNYACTACPARAECEKHPAGWGTLEGSTLCKECLNSRTCVRTARLPVLRPVGFTEGKSPERDMSSDEFFSRLRVTWEACRRLSSRTMQELYRADTLPSPGEQLQRFSPTGPNSAYNRLITADGPRVGDEAGRWQGAAICAASLIQGATRRYMNNRVAILATGKISLPTYAARHYAYPVPASMWDVAEGDGKLFVSFKLPACRLSDIYSEAKRAALAPLATDGVIPAGMARVQVKSGGEFFRQVAHLRCVIAGTARKQELKVCEQVCHSPRRGSSPAREPGGRQQYHSQVMLAFTMRLPATPPRPKERTLVVRTGTERFLDVYVEGPSRGDAAVYQNNGDHLRAGESSLLAALARAGQMKPTQAREFISRHGHWRDRLSLDWKHERRFAGGRPRHLDVLERRCRKQSDRVNTFIAQQCAAIAGICARLDVGQFILDITDRGYFATFPWHSFESKLCLRLKREGVERITTSREVEAQTHEGG